MEFKINEKEEELKETIIQNDESISNDSSIIQLSQSQFDSDVIEMKENCLNNERKPLNYNIDEFIPLASDDDNDQNETKILNKKSSNKEVNKHINKINTIIYNPTSEINDYNGPYSLKCMLRVRQSLIDDLKPNYLKTKTTYSSPYVITDRTLEILKIKLNIPSKFDNDKKILRKLSNMRVEAERDLNTKIRLRKKLSNGNLNKKNMSNKHIYFDKNENLKDHDDSDKSFISDYSDTSDDSKSDKNEIKNENENFLFNDNSNVYKSLFDVKNDDDSIQIISNDDEDESSDDVDSKCKQFDKYSKSIKNRNKVPKKVKNENLKTNYELEINKLEEKYRSTRLERNQLMKQMKKKIKNKNKKTNNAGGNSKDMKLQVINEEMKDVRKKLKRLRKSSRKFNQKTYKQRTRLKNKFPK